MDKSSGRRRDWSALLGVTLLALLGASSCGDDPKGVDDATGIVRVHVTGLLPGFTSAGTAFVTGVGLNEPIPLPGDSVGENEVPVGEYEVTYTPPLGYAIQPGTPNQRTVVVAEDSVSDVAFGVVVASGVIRIHVDGVGGDAETAGSAQILRTDITNQTPVGLIIGLSGTAQTGVLPGTYSVTYTAPDGHALVSGQTSTRTLVVGPDETEETTFVVEEVDTDGLLVVLVTGLLDGATSGGSVEIDRTEGGDAFGANIPVTGEYDTTLAAGTYSVTYTAPAGHRLVAGQTNPQTVAFQVAGSDTARFQLEALPPPDTTNVVFYSDFSTALGTSDAALLDTNKDLPWDAIIGNGSLNEVVPEGDSLDFPTTNVLKIVAQQASGGVLAQNNRIVSENGHWDVPGIGESIFYRWYFRLVVPDDLDAQSGGTPHPIQDGPSGSQTNWAFEMVVFQNGTYRPGWNLNGNAFPDNRWALVGTLDKHETYRFEMQILRTGTDAYQMHVRIFDSADNEILGDDDFANQNGTGSETLADAPTFSFEDVNRLAGFQAGNNGPGWGNIPSNRFPFTMFYQGAFAICRQEWCGPYNGTF